VNALRLAALLSVSAASFAGGRLAQPALYEPLTSASLSYVAVTPAGPCGGDAVPGPVAGGCWQTEVPWEVRSVSGQLPVLRDTHRSRTTPATVAQVSALVQAVVVPAAQAAFSGPLSVPGVYPTPTLEHVVWASFVLRVDGARLSEPTGYPALEALIVLPSLVAGVPPLRQIVQLAPPLPTYDADGGLVPPVSPVPPEAVAAVNALIESHVLPAIREETGLL
jgi:hypothetical protein